MPQGGKLSQLGRNGAGEVVVAQTEGSQAGQVAQFRNDVTCRPGKRKVYIKQKVIKLKEEKQKKACVCYLCIHVSTAFFTPDECTDGRENTMGRTASYSSRHTQT